MQTLALDVDGVLVDPDRNGDGHWTNELYRRHGIDRVDLQESFFSRCWNEVLLGRRDIEDGLGEALALIGTSVDVESVLSCWFEADFVIVDSAIELAQRAASSGVRVVLVTNQEHRRARFLRERLGAMLPIAEVIYSANLGHQKPEPAFFDEASERLGLRKEDRGSVVFVDDVLENVDTASTLGWRGVHATATHDWYAEVARLVSVG